MTRRTRAEMPTLDDVRERATIPAPPNLDPPTHEDAIELMRFWPDLDAAERRVVLSLVQRIHEGRRVYGPMEKRGRNWLREALAESLDLAVYLAAEVENIE